MASEVRKALNELKAQVAELKALVQPELPQILTKKRAARELSISMTTLNRLIAAGLVWSVQLGERQMVPASEVRRLANIQRGASRRSKPATQLRETSAKEEAAKAREMLKRR